MRRGHLRAQKMMGAFARIASDVCGGVEDVLLCVVVADHMGDQDVRQDLLPLE